MQKIRTATGKEFNVFWLGVASLDGVLRFEVSGLNMSETIMLFTNTEETRELTHIFDEHNAVYTGYTTFKGVDMTARGIVVALIGA